MLQDEKLSPTTLPLRYQHRVSVVAVVSDIITTIPLFLPCKYASCSTCLPACTSHAEATLF